jgi:hypothetical protein
LSVASPGGLAESDEPPSPSPLASAAPAAVAAAVVETASASAERGGGLRDGGVATPSKLSGRPVACTLDGRATVVHDAPPPAEAPLLSSSVSSASSGADTAVVESSPGDALLDEAAAVLVGL